MIDMAYLLDDTDRFTNFVNAFQSALYQIKQHKERVLPYVQAIWAEQAVKPLSFMEIMANLQHVCVDSQEDSSDQDYK